MIVFSTSAAQHLTKVEEIRSLLQDIRVTSKVKKRDILKSKVGYLGQTLLPGKLAPASAPTRAISGAPFPTEKFRMRYFLEAFNVYGRFVPGFRRSPDY